MAVALNAVTTSTAFANTNAVTFAHTPAGTDRLLVVGVRTRQTGAALTGLTFNGVTLTLHRAYQVNPPGIYEKVELWTLVAPAAVTANVVATFSALVENGNVVAWSFTGVNQTSPIEADGADTYASTGVTAQSLSATTVAANAMVLSLIYSEAVSGTLGAGPTERDQVAYTTLGLTNFGASATQPVASPSTVTHTWTTASARYVGFAVSIAAAARVLLPTSTTSNTGWTISAGTAHAALAAIGGARASATATGSVLRVGIS